MTDLSRMRISDADRNGVIDQLQRATVEGRLDLDELGDRITGVLAARTWSEVDPLLDDLPVVEEPTTEEPEESDEPDDSPEASPVAATVGSLATVALGAASVVGSFWTAWGAVLGLVAAVVGVLLLLGPGTLSRFDRWAVLTGTVLGLMPSGFFVMLLVILNG